MSNGGYAGYPNEAGHSNGPSRSTFTTPSSMASNEIGTTWVFDFDENDPNFGVVRIIYDTRDYPELPHVVTVGTLRSIGLSTANPGSLALKDSNASGIYYSMPNDNQLAILEIKSNRWFAGGIRRIGSTFSGGFVDGPPSVARFNRPTGLATDAAGNVYVADTNNHAIRKVTPSGDVSTVAQLSSIPSFDPTNLAVGPDGTIYATSREALYRITPGSVVRVAGGTLGGAHVPGFANGFFPDSRFSAPRGVAIDRLGDVYIADSGNAKIRRFKPATGELTTMVPPPPLDYWRGMFDVFGPDASTTLSRPVSLSFWGDRLVYGDADMHTIRTWNSTPPQPSGY